MIKIAVFASYHDNINSMDTSVYYIKYKIETYN